MKYRVEKIEHEGQRPIYLPQRKKTFFWSNYYLNNDEWTEYSQTISFYTEKEAWDYIQNHKPYPIVTHIYGETK